MSLDKNISKYLLEVSYQLHSSVELQFILNKILEKKSLSLLSTKRATIYLLDKNKEFLIPNASIYPKLEKQIMSKNIPVKSSLSGKVIKAKKGIIFNDTSQFSDSYKIPGTTDKKNENLMVLPLIAENTVFGTINFYRDNIPYTDSELEIANIFTMYASVAIQNSIKNQQLINEIEERKQIEHELKINNERYKKAQNIGKVGNWEYNIQKEQFWGSNEAKRIYGFKIDDKYFSVDAVENCIPDRKNVHQSLIDLIEQGKEYNLEFDIITHDKQIRKTIISVAQLERDEAGNPLKVSGVIHDITDRKNIEDELIKERGKYKALVESSTDAIYIIDKNGNISFANKRATKLLGKNIENVVGKNVDKLFPKDIVKDQLFFIDKVFSTGKVSHTESKHEFPAGRIWLDNILIPVFDKEGKVINSIGISRNITEKKEYEFELKKHKEHLEELVKKRTEELEEKNRLLDSSMKVFVGREKRIIDLEREIKELESKLND